MTSDLDPSRSFGRTGSQDLADADVHVVHFALNGHYDHEAFVNMLDANERFRASRLTSAAARKCFEVAHGVTRVVLARHLGIPARDIVFTRGRGGKPEIVSTSNVRFNLSHSGERAILAVAHGREVGIDLERERSVDVLEVARRFLAPSEAQTLETMPEDRRLQAFFRCWTRKESFLKARGGGLAYPLNAFEVRVDEPTPQMISSVDERGWTIADVPVAVGYSAAVTVEGIADVRLRSWVCSNELELHESDTAAAS